MFVRIKKNLLKVTFLANQINFFIFISSFCARNIPYMGKLIGLFIDRLILVFYGVDVTSSSIGVKKLSIPHPSGVLLGGNGIVSHGRVVVMAGVKFGGRRPNDPEYIARHKTKDVFQLGDNVVIGTNSVVLGPVSICDNVIIASQSLVNKSILEPGVYAGIPVKKISSIVTEEWVNSL